MTGLLLLRNVFWLSTTLAEAVLLIYLLKRKLQSTHPIFVAYLASIILQSGLAAWIYTVWGYTSDVAVLVIWGSQAVVICLRFGAVFEMAKRILSSYKGIWSLAARLISGIGLCALIYSLLVAEKKFAFLALNLDRGLELTIASSIVALLLFAKYYLLPVHPLDRALAIGFCLYSCFFVINDSIFETFLNTYLGFWGFLDVLTFLASLIIWIKAVRVYSEYPSPVYGQESILAGIYGAISPELNLRLKELNRQLVQVLRTGGE
jgi:hypothetical protein